MENYDAVIENEGKQGTPGMSTEEWIEMKKRERADLRALASDMADKALSVRSRHGYLGKIKLQGRKTWMQYMTSLYNVEVAENRPLEEYIQLLKYWVRAA